MKTLSNLIKLRYLKNMKALGYSYIAPLENFETVANSQLPQDMTKLKTMCAGCHLCDLAKNRKKVVFGEGNENAKLMFVGEGPGESEDESGRPFVGKAGELLDKIITNVLNETRNNVYIANIVKCRPPANRVPTHIEVAACKPYLLKQIELIQPKVIVALGSTALNSLLGEELTISKSRGIQYKYANSILIPTFHPSYLLRNPTAKRDVFEDMKLVKMLLAN